MMRTPSSWSVAVRRPDGGVSCISNVVTSPASRRRWLRLPVIRGVVALGESLAIGFRALAISASVASAEEGEDGEVSGELTRGQLIFAFAMAIGFTVIVFKVSPALLTDLLPIHSTIVFVLVEGVIRVSLLIGYLALISLIPDLRRVFQYHAAEHKAINAYEDGAELTPERVQSYSKIHLRCGTAFLLWVMVIAVFVFALVGRPSWPLLIASRVLLLPVIAGLAYELIRFGSKHPHNRLVRGLLSPGLWLQGLTTREPTLDQVEVSINALKDVLAAEERAQAGHGVSPVEVMA
ncbi:MAG: hypothetical protein QOJ31_368 [Gaiellales bacterium]|jgi:uncharacterized protein YqhQ|nr:hypothetical protein [Gaiellales bacterium]MDX6549684.1 hypothetical protein [Gaiellales bacterium]